MIDIEAIRADTPACETVIHFNNAGASLMPAPVFDAVRGHLEAERDLGGYEAAARAGDTIGAFYDEFAGLLNAAPREIAYVENATRAWDMAFYAIPLEPSDRIITHESEYVSNYLAYLQLAERRGIAIDCAPSDEHGQVDLAAMEAMITPRTRVIAITHVPTQGGLVNPAEAVGAIARKHGLIYVLDACQSVGQMPVDVEWLGCHILSGTGRKFLRGPRGTGFLYVSDRIVDRLDPPFIDLRAADWSEDDRYELAAGARRFENFESYVAGRIGLTAAVRYARNIGLDAVAARVADLADGLRARLEAIPGVQTHDLGARKCAIVTFTKEGQRSEDVARALSNRGVNVSVSGVGHARLDLGRRGTGPLVRASLHYFNTEDEIDRFCELVAR